MELVQVLDVEIKNIAPISGVSVGRKDDKSTWKVHFLDEATDEHKKSVERFIDEFSWDNVKKQDAERQAKANDALQNLALKKLYMLEKEKNPNLSVSQFLDNIESAVIQ